MKLYELFEGRVKNLAIDRDYDRKHDPQPEPTLPSNKKEFNFYLLVNGKPWGQFTTEKHAIAAGNTLKQNKPWLRIDVMPRKL